ncbi:hypothetical protein [Sinorhizobium alkalisoli]|uniref:hypothetical protein n=1 Tax=Sinorhizobium alkalisoli TaxID=1752398 RepID=UPI00124E69B1|nr:hypothetical protein [Sinorhizobium alkalisoli]QFI65752.1 Membrane protein involved in colicin uptake [Sinorhizobium alkalisoli]
MTVETSIWTWWQNALAGNFGPMHEGQPEQGYYRTRFKGAQWEPVAIWRGDDGEWLAMRGERMVDAAEAWNFCRTHPVSYEAYQKAIEGAGWDDEPPAPAMGHNLPDDPFEALKLEYEAEAEQALAFMKTPITTQDQADKAAIWSKRLAAIAKKATDLHKVEKQPHLDAGRDVDNKWRDLKDAPADLSKKLKRHMDAYLIEQQRIERERQRKAQEEADRKRREAEALAAQADVSDTAAQAEAERLQKEADKQEQAAQAKNAQAGRTGARVSLRTFVSARIVDYDKALKALSNHPEMKALVETLANRAVRAGVEIDGVERFEEQRAA